MTNKVRKPHKHPSERQKKRIAKYLSGDEDVICITSIGQRYVWINMIFFLLLPLGLFYFSIFAIFGIVKLPQEYGWIKIAGIIVFALALFKLKNTSHILRKRQSNVYVLTNRRILIKTGLFSRKIVTAPLNRITHITIDQSFIQRFLYNTGHLLIITAGFDQREIVVEHIASPVDFKILVEESTIKTGKSQSDENKDAEEEEMKIRAISF